jgi:hypothetical protein
MADLCVPLLNRCPRRPSGQARIILVEPHRVADSPSFIVGNGRERPRSSLVRAALVAGRRGGNSDRARVVADLGAATIKATVAGPDCPAIACDKWSAVDPGGCSQVISKLLRRCG